MANDTGFLGKLRMNGLFPVGEGAQQYGNSGDGDLEGVLNALRKHRNLRNFDDDNRASQQRQLTQGIGANDQFQQRPPSNIDISTGPGLAISPVTSKNVVFKDTSLTDYQKGQLAIQRGNTAQKALASQGSLDIRQQQANVAARKVELAAKIASGQATDAEKQEWQMDQIEARGNNALSLADRQGDNRMEQIGAQGDNQMGLQRRRASDATELQGLRGNQSLEQIDRRTSGQQQLQDSRPQSSTQQIAGIRYNASKFVSTHPDMAKYIVQDPNTGQINNTAPPESVEFDMINQALFGGDIDLPAGNTNQNQDQAPPVNRPAVQPSRFKVTIE